ncbi:MAG: hypothetical protein IJS30_04735 [Bacteroidales bacterium]|nr:hypothetical protein [Bacteroidales bacterium]
MKSKDDIQKDWQEILREKAGNVAGVQPQVSFAELKEKMVAAGAGVFAGAGRGASAGAAGASAGTGAAAGTGAGTGAAAGSGRRGLSWLKYAAAVAVIGASGVMLFMGPDKGGAPSSSTAENRKADEVTVVSEPVLETEPAAAAALLIEAVDPVDNGQDETIPVDLTKLTANDAASSNAPSGSSMQRPGNVSDNLSHRSGESAGSQTYSSGLTAEQKASAVAPSKSTKGEPASTGGDPAASVKNLQTAEASEPNGQINTDYISENAESSSPATNASNSAAGSNDTQSGVTPVEAASGNATESGDSPADAAPAAGGIKQDPFAEPVKPIKKQLRRFSVGASGFLASNGIGNGNSNSRNMPADMVTYTDRNGKVFYSYSAPSVRYNHSAPISGGISLRYNFTPVFYAESGLRLTYLHTWISPSGAAQDLLYAGIPIGVGGNFVRLGNASFYASAYGMLSKCVMGHNSAGFPSNYSQLSDIPLMWSAGASIGAAYNITRTFGLFAEPTVSYYFPTSNAPQTIYKENPWYFTLNLGVRFNLN